MVHVTQNLFQLQIVKDKLLANERQTTVHGRTCRRTRTHLPDSEPTSL
jgi:hypothetical protein